MPFDAEHVGVRQSERTTPSTKARSPRPSSALPVGVGATVEYVSTSKAHHARTPLLPLPSPKEKAASLANAPLLLPDGVSLRASLVRVHVEGAPRDEVPALNLRLPSLEE